MTTAPEARRRRGVGRIALDASIALAMLVFISLAVLPRTGAYRTLTVRTGSMAPAIPRGAVVVVVPQAPQELRVGQVITYQAPLADGRVITHRVVAIEEPGAQPVIRTKGDANAAEDPWKARITDARVWRVRWTVPVAGHVIASLRHPLARSLSIYAVPALLALIWLRDIWRKDPAPVMRERVADA